MKRTHLRAVALFVASIALALATAGAAFAGEAGDKANSWRYQDGQRIQQTAEPQDTGSTLHAISTLGSKVTYCWKKSYGTLAMYDAQSGHGYTTVSGALEVAIDVSVWDGKIDWQAVANDGITSVIIRCGYGSNKSSQDDKYWLANVKGAKAAGLKVGVYLYSYATKITGNDSSAQSESQHVLRCLSEAGLTPDTVDLPIYIDIEESYQENYSSKKLESMVLQFANPLEQAGYRVGIYAGADLLSGKLNTETINAQNYSKWVPHYNNHCMYCKTSSGKQDSIGNYGKYLDIWQFGSVGKVSGISADVDMNFIFNDIDNYKLRYVLFGGINNQENPKDYEVGSEPITLKDPTREGYTFVGWYSSPTYAADTKVTSIDCAIDGKQNIYAKWKAIKYKITYKKNKGTLPTAYTKYFTIETATFSLPIPGRKGYGFAGWYTTPDFSGKAVTKVSWGTIGSKKLYAKWTKGGFNAKAAVKTAYYSKPNLKSKKVKSLSKGTLVCISKTNKSKTWGYVEGKGWVKFKYVPATTYYVKVTASTLNARKGAGTDFKKTAKLKKGAKVWIYETSNGWGHALGKGWIKMEYTVKA